MLIRSFSVSRNIKFLTANVMLSSIWTGWFAEKLYSRKVEILPPYDGLISSPFLTKWPTIRSLDEIIIQSITFSVPPCYFHLITRDVFSLLLGSIFFRYLMNHILISKIYLISISYIYTWKTSPCHLISRSYNSV